MFSFDISFIKSKQIPASFGVQGPGDNTIPLYFFFNISLVVILSFLYTSILAPSSKK